MMYHFFNAFCTAASIDFDKFMALGRQNPEDRGERFSMAILALKTSNYRNAVSELHGEISKEMWHALWPEIPVNEIPITSITNGVHLPSWLNGDLALLYDQYLQPDWRERHAGIRYIHDHIDVVDVEPLTRDAGADIGLVQPVGVDQLDLPAMRLCRQHEAASHHDTIQQHAAGAADPVLAAEMGSG